MDQDMVRSGRLTWRSASKAWKEHLHLRSLLGEGGRDSPIFRSPPNRVLRFSQEPAGSGPHGPSETAHGRAPEGLELLIWPWSKPLNGIPSWGVFGEFTAHFRLPILVGFWLVGEFTTHLGRDFSGWIGMFTGGNGF